MASPPSASYCCMHNVCPSGVSDQESLDVTGPTDTNFSKKGGVIMFTVIDKEVYSTLELVLAQLFGEKFNVSFASYHVPRIQDQDFDNATQIYFSIIANDLEDF